MRGDVPAGLPPVVSNGRPSASQCSSSCSRNFVEDLNQESAVTLSKVETGGRPRVLVSLAGDTRPEAVSPLTSLISKGGCLPRERHHQQVTNDAYRQCAADTPPP